MWLFNLLFSSLSQHWYVEVRISQSVSVSPLEFEITRVDCIYMSYVTSSQNMFLSRNKIYNWAQLFKTNDVVS